MHCASHSVIRHEIIEYTMHPEVIEWTARSDVNEYNMFH